MDEISSEPQGSDVGKSPALQESNPDPLEGDTGEPRIPCVLEVRRGPVFPGRSLKQHDRTENSLKKKKGEEEKRICLAAHDKGARKSPGGQGTGPFCQEQPE